MSSPAVNLDQLHALLILYALMLLANILISGILWLKTRQPLYRTLLFVWVAVSVNLILGGAAADYPSIVQLLVFSLTVLFTYPLALLLATIVGFPVPRRRVAFSVGFAVALTLFLRWIDAPRLLYSLPIPIAVSIPGYHAALTALFRHRRKLNTMTAGFAVVLLLYSLHMTDFSVLHDVPSFLIAGFTLAIVLVLSLSILAPAAIAETVAKENESLRFRVEYEAQAKHSAKMAAIGDLAGGMAHEINTPLAIVRMKVEQTEELLAEQTLDPSLIREVFAGTSEALNRIAAIVRGLRVFAGHDIPEAGKFSRLPSLMADIVSISADRLRQAAVELTQRGEIPDVATRCPPSELMQVLVNVIGNACDAVEALPDRWIRLSYEKLAAAVEIRVTDSGSGISPEVAQKIMQPFFTTKPIGKGTGMGLSLSKGIVERYGGEIRYELHEGHTSFVVNLPIQAE